VAVHEGVDGGSLVRRVVHGRTGGLCRGSGRADLDAVAVAGPDGPWASPPMWTERWVGRDGAAVFTVQRGTQHAHGAPGADGTLG
ncbi:hypothetical protein NGM37_48560, partial [Streptomyces sp. TRM76130]|nr:hypothetical protein [Streptomyces sp. TRM76130]